MDNMYFNGGGIVYYNNVSISCAKVKIQCWSTHAFLSTSITDKYRPTTVATYRHVKAFNCIEHAYSPSLIYELRVTFFYTITGINWISLIVCFIDLLIYSRSRALSCYLFIRHQRVYDILTEASCFQKNENFRYPLKAWYVAIAVPQDYNNYTEVSSFCLGCGLLHFIYVVQEYSETCNMIRTLRGNKIVDHSDVAGASPVGAAPTTSLFAT